ncbi:uncharacterized protein ASCRUDRAFT_106978 [Ascoidea rubescens DSM 1968]|uniref:Uncharacterized protein n=1 Tax=Ascoidea rubescens DSM 1968 TaxID=1344418 RepID=A0A1D2VDS2_9ASCO|nr:hypothetical protein ASCRUDRAFT_106978 [Ascoidea rubescens DSM 1968]ODV59791.1 hypothetical protein ASCRUDRAFT_106978 [Ascoidea rubescens DSM 1968]
MPQDLFLNAFHKYSLAMLLLFVNNFNFPIIDHIQNLLNKNPLYQRIKVKSPIILSNTQKASQLMQSPTRESSFLGILSWLYYKLNLFNFIDYNNVASIIDYSNLHSINLSEIQHFSDILINSPDISLNLIKHFPYNFTQNSNIHSIYNGVHPILNLNDDEFNIFYTFNQNDKYQCKMSRIRQLDHSSIFSNYKKLKHTNFQCINNNKISIRIYENLIYDIYKIGNFNYNNILPQYLYKELPVDYQIYSRLKNQITRKRVRSRSSTNINDVSKRNLRIKRISKQNNNQKKNNLPLNINFPSDNNNNNKLNLILINDNSPLKYIEPNEDQNEIFSVIMAKISDKIPNSNPRSLLQSFQNTNQKQDKRDKTFSNNKENTLVKDEFNQDPNQKLKNKIDNEDENENENENESKTKTKSEINGEIKKKDDDNCDLEHLNNSYINSQVNADSSINSVKNNVSYTKNKFNDKINLQSFIIHDKIAEIRKILKKMYDIDDNYNNNDINKQNVHRNNEDFRNREKSNISTNTNINREFHYVKKRSQSVFQNNIINNHIINNKNNVENEIKSKTVSINVDDDINDDIEDVIDIDDDDIDNYEKSDFKKSNKRNEKESKNRKAKRKPRRGVRRFSNDLFNKILDSESDSEFEEYLQKNGKLLEKSRSGLEGESSLLKSSNNYDNTNYINNNSNNNSNNNLTNVKNIDNIKDYDKLKSEHLKLQQLYNSTVEEVNAIVQTCKSRVKRLELKHEMEMNELKSAMRRKFVKYKNENLNLKKQIKSIENLYR